MYCPFYPICFSESPGSLLLDRPRSARCVLKHRANRLDKYFVVLSSFAWMGLERERPAIQFGRRGGVRPVLGVGLLRISHYPHTPTHPHALQKSQPSFLITA